MAWDPSQYLRFAGPRFQPGIDLIHRLPELDTRCVVDLGCGTGDLTALLAARFPRARVVGLDNSREMLAKARASHPELAFEEADAAIWSPRFKPEVLFSNAALQWVPDHDELLPRLLSCVAEGGVLAIQMPRNFDQPSHTLIREVARELGVLGRLALRQDPVRSPADYYDLVAPHAAELEIWETVYLHALEGEDPVFEWTRGTALLPVFQALDGEELEGFLGEYRRRLSRAYPRRPDGRTLFPFRRVFVLARRSR
jgi:trans-aconitate 2-methyltransferase